MLPGLLAEVLQKDPVAVLRENARLYGDLVHFRSFAGHVYQFNHPTLIGEIMIDHERRNRRAMVLQRARALLGEGLLTSEEPLHMRQRRLAAPAFHRQRIAAYGEVISRYAAEVVEGWQPGVRNVHPEMLMVALRIVGKCLFDIDSVEEAERIAAAMRTFMEQRPLPSWIPGRVLEKLQNVRVGPMQTIWRGIEALDGILYGLIAERRRSPGDRGDLLSMLMESEDTEEMAAGSGLGTAERRMSDKQVRDECLTVLLAGHETTANALSFTLWTLARHPEVQERAHREAVEVLGAGRPKAEDYPRLRYTYGVFAEAMRLYPTVWVLGRSCGPEPYDFHGYRIEPGATLLAPQIVAHRDPRFWEDPEVFRPERFAEEGKRPKFSYFPFGGGTRQCIGEGLAWMEGVFVLATILRDWRLRPAPGEPEELPMTSTVNLRPARGVRLLLERR